MSTKEIEILEEWNVGKIEVVNLMVAISSIHRVIIHVVYSFDHEHIEWGRTPQVAIGLYIYQCSRRKKSYTAYVGTRSGAVSNAIFMKYFRSCPGYDVNHSISKSPKQAFGAISVYLNIILISFAENRISTHSVRGNRSQTYIRGCASSCYFRSTYPGNNR